MMRKGKKKVEKIIFISWNLAVLHFLFFASLCIVLIPSAVYSPFAIIGATWLTFLLAALIQFVHIFFIPKKSKPTNTH